MSDSFEIETIQNDLQDLDEAVFDGAGLSRIASNSNSIQIPSGLGEIV